MSFPVPGSQQKAGQVHLEEQEVRGRLMMDDGTLGSVCERRGWNGGGWRARRCVCR